MLSAQSSELTTSEREYIKSAIAHFFYDLPTEEKALTEKITQIQQAFAQELKEGEFFDLQNCIHQPTVYLRLLDMQNKNISIGSVQRYILNFAQRALEAAAKKNELNITALGWGVKKSLTQLKKSKDYHKKFESKKTPEAGGDNFWHLQSPAGTIYTAEFDQSSEEEKTPVDPFTINSAYLKLRVNVNLSETYTSTRLIKHFKRLPAFSSDSNIAANEEKEFIIRITSEALERAQHTAIDIILEELDLLSEYESEDISAGARILLTYQYYYEGIKDYTIDFDAVRKISDGQADILTHPNIIHLIQYDFLSLKEALSLTKKQKNVIVSLFFFEKILKKNYRPEDFLNLLDDQCELLCLPAVHHLFQKNMLTSLTEAKNLPIDLITILKDEFYYALLIKDERIFSALRRVSYLQSQHLILPQVIRLISQDVLKLSEMHLSAFWVEIFDLRLFAIYQGKPLTINIIPDKVKTVIRHMTEIATEKLFPLAEFKQAVSKKVLNHIKITLESELKVDASLPKIYKNIYHAINDAERDEKAVATFSTLASIATETINKLTRNFPNMMPPQEKRARLLSGFFSPIAPRTAELGIKEFCERIIDLSLLEATETKLTPSTSSSTDSLAITLSRKRERN